MFCKRKKRLMVVVGAGASIDLGMPSVNDIDKLFSSWAMQDYEVAGQNRSLYCFFRDRINDYYNQRTQRELAKKANFEEVLYLMLQMAGSLGDAYYQQPMNALWKPLTLPHICSSRGVKSIGRSELRSLCLKLIDNLLQEFRDRCRYAQIKHPKLFESWRRFLGKLACDYDVAFISLNYDNLVTQACPGLFTGFNETSGFFDRKSVFDRSKFGLIYHLHGSVHFDMQPESTDLHRINWRADLDGQFGQNSLGRNNQQFPEGVSLPTSVIVAGYAKTNQLLRDPFSTYFSRVGELSQQADALLFMGYGFGDIHLNHALGMKEEGQRKKPVVVLGYSSETEDPLEFRHGEWAHNLGSAIPFNASDMVSRQFPNSPPDIGSLIEGRDFEVSKNPKFPLAVWHGGILDACKNYRKVRSELENGAVVKPK